MPALRHIDRPIYNLTLNPTDVMKKFFFSFLFALVLFPVFAEETPLMLQGRVKEAAFKTDLTNAIVLTLDSAGNVADTIPCNQGFSYRHFEVDTLSNFYLKVPRVDSTYGSLPGYDNGFRGEDGKPCFFTVLFSMALGKQCGIRRMGDGI